MFGVILKFIIYILTALSVKIIHPIMYRTCMLDVKTSNIFFFLLLFTPVLFYVYNIFSKYPEQLFSQENGGK